jgi:hypothetical protein
MSEAARLGEIRSSTSFLCYIVADITPRLEERIIGRFGRTPDGEGYFGYTTNPAAFVEIVPFGKVMNDARQRNAIFFQKPGPRIPAGVHRRLRSINVNARQHNGYI